MFLPKTFPALNQFFVTLFPKIPGVRYLNSKTRGVGAAIGGGACLFVGSI